MKKLKVNNIGLKGINTDIAPWDLPPEFITYGKNFRVYANYVSSAGGAELWDTAPESFNPGYIMHVGDISGDYWLVMGRNKAYAFDGNVFTDVSSAGGYPGLVAGSELLWSGCMLGRIPIVNNPQHYPEYWSPPAPGNSLQPLMYDSTRTWADFGLSAKVVRSHKNFLFALNLQEGPTEFPSAYRWSHPADINGLPFSWDPDDNSSIAGRAQIGANYGEIIDGLTLRDSFAIYSENGINILDLSGDEFIWRRRELSSSIGLISRNCIAEIKGVHFFLGDGDILRNDGNSIESIVHGRIQRQFTARLNADAFDTSYVVRNNVTKEIWFCVPEIDSPYPNVAYIYNWKDDSWAVKEIPLGIAFANYGPQNQPPSTWDSAQGTWDQQVGPWGSRRRTPLDDTIVGVNNQDSSLYIIDPKGFINTGDISCILERTDFPLEDLNDVTTITSVYPHIQGTNPVSIQLGSQKIAGGPVRWKPARQFIPGQDRKIDIRTTGALHCWRIKSIGTGTFNISGMDFEYVPAGKR